MLSIQEKDFGRLIAFNNTDFGNISEILSNFVTAGLIVRNMRFDPSRNDLFSFLLPSVERFVDISSESV